MPDEMKNGSHLYGVELDSLTGRIEKAIYLDAEINIQGFEDTRYLNNFFDLAVGNVPFGNCHVNYFIAKMIDQVRPNGFVAVITSKGTLDKQDSRARRYFARRTDLVRAIRLPNNAFKAAGTEVTCDILFFRKFDRNLSLDKSLHDAMQSMPRIYLPSATELPLAQQIAEVEDRPLSSFFIENGKLKFYDGVKTETVKINAQDRAQMLLAMEMRDSVRKVIDIQVNDGSNEELETAQKTLNDTYDKHVKIYGHICEDTSLKKIFGNDSAYPLLRSLEKYGKKKLYFRLTKALPFIRASAGFLRYFPDESHYSRSLRGAICRLTTEIGTAFITNSGNGVLKIFSTTS